MDWIIEEVTLVAGDYSVLIRDRDGMMDDAQGLQYTWSARDGWVTVTEGKAPTVSQCIHDAQEALAKHKASTHDIPTAAHVLAFLDQLRDLGNEAIAREKEANPTPP